MADLTLTDLPLDQQVLVRQVVSRLTPAYEGTLGAETVERFVVDSLEQLLPKATVATHLPVLAEKFAKDRLRALLRLEESAGDAIPGVLFLCVHNAGRSQMAAGWLRHLAGDRMDAVTGIADQRQPFSGNPGGMMKAERIGGSRR